MKPCARAWKLRTFSLCFPSLAISRRRPTYVTPINVILQCSMIHSGFICTALMSSRRDDTLTIEVILRLTTSMPNCPIRHQKRSRTRARFKRRQGVFLFELVNYFCLCTTFTIRDMTRVMANSCPKRKRANVRCRRAVICNYLMYLCSAFLLYVFPDTRAFVMTITSLGIVYQFPGVKFRNAIRRLFSLSSPARRDANAFFCNRRNVNNCGFRHFKYLLGHNLPTIVLRL